MIKLKIRLIWLGMKFIVCHCGSSSALEQQDGARSACEQGRKLLQSNKSALEAVIATAEYLENDERFNAGTGSNIRLDGKTIEMDASCMSSNGALGAVAAIERVKNPVQVAYQVTQTPHIFLVGAGATAFARKCGFADYDPSTEGARQRLQKVLAMKDQMGEWSLEALKKAWNFDTPLSEALGCDTIGSVAWDGETFASSLSTGGTTAVLRGRVGDVPLPGCGLYAGPAGAIAATGEGEYIAKAFLAYRAYEKLTSGNLSPQEVVDWALKEIPAHIDIGIIVVNKTGFAGNARHSMAWEGIEC